jgi:hypothetical protein
MPVHSMNANGRRLARGILAFLAACTGACERPPADRDTAVGSRQQAPIARCTDAAITDDAVGVIRIGMSVDSVRAECPIARDTTEMNEGEPERAVYALVAGDTIRLRVSNDAVRVIAVRRPTFMTADSIHVGMPLSRFLVGRHPRVLVGEGKVYLRVDGHCGNSFGLSGEAYRRLPGLREATLGQLPATTVIDEILVVGTSTRLPNDRCD